MLEASTVALLSNRRQAFIQYIIFTNTQTFKLKLVYCTLTIEKLVFQLPQNILGTWIIKLERQTSKQFLERVIPGSVELLSHYFQVTILMNHHELHTYCWLLIVISFLCSIPLDLYKLKFKGTLVFTICRVYSCSNH